MLIKIYQVEWQKALPVNYVGAYSNVFQSAHSSS